MFNILNAYMLYAISHKVTLGSNTKKFHIPGSWKLMQEHLVNRVKSEEKADMVSEKDRRREIAHRTDSKTVSFFMFFFSFLFRYFYYYLLLFWFLFKMPKILE